MPDVVYITCHILNFPKKTERSAQRGEASPCLPGTKLLKVTVLCPTKSRPIGS